MCLLRTSTEAFSNKKNYDSPNNAKTEEKKNQTIKIKKQIK